MDIAFEDDCGDDVTSLWRVLYLRKQRRCSEYFASREAAQEKVSRLLSRQDSSIVSVREFRATTYTPLGPRHNSLTRQRLAEQGVEMTPDELVANRKEAYAAIRSELRAKGYNVPDDDVALFHLIRLAYKQEDADA